MLKQGGDRACNNIVSWEDHHKRSLRDFPAGFRLFIHGVERCVLWDLMGRGQDAERLQSKRDLGFVEGDFIECLNAGDGSWWTGRLRRDRRAVGLFPSNFVRVLDESFQPTPTVSRNATPPTQNQNSPSPQKSKSVFRKPFQAYEKLGPDGSTPASRGSTPEKEKPKKKFAPYSSMKTAQAPGTAKKEASPSPLKEESTFRVPSPPPRGGIRAMSRTASPAPTSRAPSPNPSAMYRASSPTPTYRPVSPAAQSMFRARSPAPSHYRPVSPRPGDDYHSRPTTPQNIYRQPSPAPYQQYYQQPFPDPAAEQYAPYAARPPSPMPDPDMADMADIGSSPAPPAPPPHRIAYQPSRVPSPAQVYDEVHGGVTGGAHSPIPHSPGMTPSPLRDAMNDVMSSLHDMSSIAGRSPSPRPAAPTDVWSPEAFEEIHHRTVQHIRAQSRDENGGQEQVYDRPGTGYSGHSSSGPSLPPSRDGPPQLGNYVQRMEHRLRHTQSSIAAPIGNFYPDQELNDPAPTVPLKPSGYAPRTTMSRPSTAGSGSGSELGSRSGSQRRPLTHHKSAYEMGQHRLNRSYTTKTSATSSSSGNQSTTTNSTNSTSMTSVSLMSGQSAGAFSATSAGSFARRKWGITGSVRGRRPLSVLSSRSQGDIHDAYNRDGANLERPQSPISGVSYHSSHATQPAPTPVADWTTNPFENAGILGGLSAPKAKKSGFFKKMIETAKTTAKTGAANARSTIGSTTSSRPSSRAASPRKSMLPDGVTAIAGGTAVTNSSDSAHRDMGLGGGSDWMQVRRDVNRSNSLSKNERNERAERCQMLEIPALNPIEELLDLAEGDEGLDGLPIAEPNDFNPNSLMLVDKNTRFISSIPPMATAVALAQSYLCRPYRSDVQRLRAIFTWVAERITWEEDFEGEVDTRRVIQTKRGCNQEIAVLVRDLCAAVGLHAEVVRGYLKAPGEVLDFETIAHPNHWWNAVIVDGEWRIMDCSLAGPTNPKRSMYSSANGNVAENWWFLTRPMEVCYTHVPLLPEQQHIVPPMPHEVLMALPCACPPYFRHQVELTDFDTSLLHLENLEMCQIKLYVPEDVECVAEVEARAFARDIDGDLFESGDVVKKAAFAQAEWVGGRKRFTVKALLPGDEGHGVLKIYAGKRGLMHSIRDNPHPLALSLPLSHTGQNPPYTFVTRHPTPHAQRHDLYIAQPQCHRLVINNTFVFCVRQHTSSLSRFSPDTWGGASNGRTSALGRPTSPNPYVRPTSAMSMISASASVSQPGSNSSYEGGQMSDKQSKPAKLAIQSPSGKIIRLVRKQEFGSRGAVEEDEESLASSWETVIKVGERGTWRSLVLADRSARWCVFAEWECV
ncbi:hypothetical protein M8818_005293 [Zalaria obscura]|uniref:Uncharacterized protein n=1 Tax=Zalaria obscura TaxID=2024903 RepID=A0ACC3S9E3_9PEZI